jgi:hypothetical protein
MVVTKMIDMIRDQDFRILLPLKCRNSKRLMNTRRRSPQNHRNNHILRDKYLTGGDQHNDRNDVIRGDRSTKGYGSTDLRLDISTEKTKFN